MANPFQIRFSQLLGKFVANPILRQGSYWMLVKFGPMSGAATALGSTLALLAALSIYGPGNTYQFFFYYFLSFPAIVLFFSILAYRVFIPAYWVRMTKEIIAGTWVRPQATFFAGLFPLILFSLILGTRFDVDFFTFMDLLSPILMIILGFSRLACLNFGCCYGIVKENKNGFCVKYDHKYSWPNRIDPENHGIPRVPTQLIESLITLVLSIPVILAFVYGRSVGLPSALFFIFQGGLRFIVDFFRYSEEPKFLKLSKRQFACLISFCLGIAMLFSMPVKTPLTFSPIDIGTALKTIPLVAILGFLLFSFVFGLHRTEQSGTKDLKEVIK